LFIEKLGHMFKMKANRYSQTMKNKDVYHQKWQGKWDIIFERCNNV